MARSPTTLDAFAAIAEPRRREVLVALLDRELQVNDLVLHLGWPQPQVSKHLGVLREVGLVKVRQDGRKRIYEINGDAMKPVHDWVSTFERYWDDQLRRIRERAEAKHKQTKEKST